MNTAYEITKLLHDNFWIVLSFAFGQPTIAKIMSQKFAGEWNYLHKSVYENAEIRADRALMEMATQLRVLDEAEELNEAFKREQHAPFGIVVQPDGTQTEMHLRDLTDKIIKAERFEWRLCDSSCPKIIVSSNEPERWQHAEISVMALIRLVGSLGY
jgi:hypothetical protein